MASFSLLGFFFLSLTHRAAGIQPSDHLLMFSSLGESISLPCGVPSITSCSSVTWSMLHSGEEVVKAGKVTDPHVLKLGLLEDCSLKIHHLVLDYAQIYLCKSGAFNSSVSLRILEIQTSSPSAGEIKLECYLNTHTGFKGCNNTEMQITWTTGQNTPLTGGRFHSEKASDCFLKMTFIFKPTDHHRKWRCQMSLNNTVKASTTTTMELKDGIEEVFAAVGESVSLSCRNTSSLSMGSRAEWGMVSHTLTDNMSPDKRLNDSLHVNKDSSLEINKVSPLHTGDYQCSDGQQVFHRIRLQTLDVTSENSPEGRNLTLTCLLTCSKKCEDDFNLTWSGGGLQSDLINKNNTLIRRLYVQSSSIASGGSSCSVYREGEMMASKRWHSLHPLQTAAWLWLFLVLGLLVMISAGALYTYRKRKHKDSENELTSIGMNHVYEGIEDHHIEEHHQQRKTKRGAATTTDSFYDLLQAVN